MKYSIKLIK